MRDINPAPIVQQDESRATLHRVVSLVTERNLQRARAELSTYELGMLLLQVRRDRLAEKLHSISFHDWCAERLTDRAGQPMRSHNVDKLIEQAQAIEPWPRLRAYHESMLSPGEKPPCKGPERLRGKKPCVTWWSCCETVRYAKLDCLVEDELATLEGLHEQEAGAPADLYFSQTKLLPKARHLVEDRLIMLAHETTRTLRDMMQETRERRGYEQPASHRRMLWVVDPGVEDRWKEAVEFVLDLEDIPQAGRSRLSDDFVLERVSGLLLDFKDRVRRRDGDSEARPDGAAKEEGADADGTDGGGGSSGTGDAPAHEGGAGEGGHLGAGREPPG